MKKILSEDRIDYQNYRFGYCVNIILEEDDSIEKAFERGYLPYTGDSKNTEEIYSTIVCGFDKKVSYLLKSGKNNSKLISKEKHLCDYAHRCG